MKYVLGSVYVNFDSLCCEYFGLSPLVILNVILINKLLRLTTDLTGNVPARTSLQ